jgi:hypothetical protein
MTSSAGSSADSLLTRTGFRDWSAEWAEFEARNPGFAAADPIYCLPTAAIVELAGSWGKRAPFLDSTREQSEKEFTDLCTRHKVIGVWLGQMVRYDYLLPDGPTLTGRQVTRRSKAHVRKGSTADSKISEVRSRLRGVVGWLLTDPTFVRELTAVQAAWKALPRWERPAFPLTRARRAVAPPSDAVPADPAMSSFAESFHNLMDRWGLTRLMTWDLPEPQGPFLPSAVPPWAQAMPQHGVHLVVPIHYPVQGNDALLKLVQEQQQALASRLGIDGSFAGLPHYGVYDQIFRLRHLQQAMQARLHPEQSPRGLVDMIKRAAVEVLPVTEGYFDKLNKGMKRCLRGERAKVSWLRPRDR